MKIESILKRPGGSIIPIGAANYHFLPDALDRHVCDVDDPAHQQVLLRVPEGFRSLEAAAPATVTPDDALATLAKSYPGLDIAAVLAAAARQTTETAAVQADTAISTIPTVPADAGQTGEEGGDDAANDEKPGAAETTGLAALSDDDLKQVFKDEVGRVAHHKSGRDTLIAQIEQARAEKAGAGE